MRTSRAASYLLGGIPFVMLVLALPFVNRVEPLVLGLPFLLFWILLWIVMTPLVLLLAYRIERNSDSSKEGDQA